MPLFRVTFSNAVVYLRGHLKGQRETMDLIVTAPDGPKALVHALRVVEGDPGDVAWEPYEESARVIPIETGATP